MFANFFDNGKNENEVNFVRNLQLCYFSVRQINVNGAVGNHINGHFADVA